MKKFFGFIVSVLAWCFVVATGWVLGADLVGWGFDGDLVFQDFGSLWFDLHHRSLNLTQAIIQRHLAPALFDNILLPLLLSPAALVMFGLSVLFFLLRRLLSR